MYRVLAVIITVIILFAVIGRVTPWSQTASIEWQPADGLSRTIVEDVAPAPDESDQIYAGTSSHGVYLTDDYVNKGWIKDDLDPGFRDVYPVQDVAIPTDRIRDILIHDSGAVFVGTWGTSVYWKSPDVPDTWIKLWPEPLGEGVDLAESLVVAGPDSNTLYVGTYGGVLYADLTTLIPGETPPDLMETGLVLSNEEDECVQAITSQLRADLELDSGEILPTNTYLPVNDLIVDPQDSNHLYAAIWQFGVCESRDAGASWHKLADGPDGKLLNANALAISPTTPDVLFLGTFGRGIFRSEDTGRTWEAWNTGDIPADADIWSLQFDANGETLYAGTRYDGTYILPPNAEWQKIEELSYGALSLAVDPQSGAMLAGTWGGGIYKESESGAEWTSLQMPALPLKIHTVVQNSVALFIGTASDGVWRSNDGGASWNRISGMHTEGDYIAGSSLEINALLVDSADRLYAGTGEGLYLSRNSGDTWTRIDPDGEPPARILSLLSMEQGGEQYILAGTDRNQGKDIFFFSLTDTTWHQIPTPKGKVNALAFFEGNLYASVRGAGLFMVPDNTPLLEMDRDDWVETNVPADFVDELQTTHSTFRQWLIHGTTPQLLALTERGIYRSHDGQRWEQTAVGIYGSLAVDAEHPQISYLSSILTNTKSLSTSLQTLPLPAQTETAGPATFTQTVRSMERPLLVSGSDGGGWPHVAKSPDPDTALTDKIVTMIADDTESGRVYGATDNGLLIGEASLSPLFFWREFAFYFLTLAVLALAGRAIIVPYQRLTRPFNISLPYAIYLYFSSRRQLELVWDREGVTRLSDVEQLVLLYAPSQPFTSVEMWKKLDLQRAVPPIAELRTALSTLTYERGILAKLNGTYQLRQGMLKKIAKETFGRNRNKTKERIRNDHAIYRDSDRFFTLAGFDVQTMGTEYLLRPETGARLAWHDTWARLHLGGELTPADVNTFGEQVEERQIDGPSFIIVTERPTPAGYRALARWNDAHASQLILVDVQSMQQALRERNANTVLDTLLRRAEPGYDHFALYTPVRDPLNFFGQVKPLDDVRSLIKTSPDRPIIVRGLPKAGVTSFLQRVQSTMDGIPCALVEPQYERTRESLLYTVTYRLLDDLQRKHPTPRHTELLTDIQNAGPDSDRVADILASLEPVDDIDRFVVLLDGAGLPASEQDAFAEDARQLMTDYPHLLVGLSTSAVRAQPEHPTVSVDPLSREETMLMIETIRAAMGRDNWSEAVMETLFEQTGGHPWFVRQIGSALSRRESAVTPEDVRTVASELVDSRSVFFESLWDSLPEEAQTELLAGDGAMPAWLEDVGLTDGGRVRIGMLGAWLRIEMGVLHDYAEYA